MRLSFYAAALLPFILSSEVFASDTTTQAAVDAFAQSELEPSLKSMLDLKAQADAEAFSESESESSGEGLVDLDCLADLKVDCEAGIASACEELKQEKPCFKKDATKQPSFSAPKTTSSAPPSSELKPKESGEKKEKDKSKTMSVKVDKKSPEPHMHTHSEKKVLAKIEGDALPYQGNHAMIIHAKTPVETPNKTPVKAETQNSEPAKIVKEQVPQKETPASQPTPKPQSSTPCSKAVASMPKPPVSLHPNKQQHSIDGLRISILQHLKDELQHTKKVQGPMGGPMLINSQVRPNPNAHQQGSIRIISARPAQRPTLPCQQHMSVMRPQAQVVKATPCGNRLAYKPRPKPVVPTVPQLPPKAPKQAMGTGGFMPDSDVKIEKKTVKLTHPEGPNSVLFESTQSTEIRNRSNRRQRQPYPFIVRQRFGPGPGGAPPAGYRRITMPQRGRPMPSMRGGSFMPPPFFNMDRDLMGGRPPMQFGQAPPPRMVIRSMTP